MLCADAVGTALIIVPRRRQFIFGRQCQFAQLARISGVVQPDEFVLFPVDISWASTAEQAREDLLRLAANPYLLA